ncbi:hypothetical protein TUM19329_25990 [Legionella antarctica]|uniref:Uncharacterized protein n=1 Tax=Legionella antarctica TaxID=2708020 RepID=A0A6F8T750_9GAMM|nr:hypothetical protein [Legionella antarctica]BCA96238.1 hypothetical protein TUM19329_25990 [Legionella antarctica]
MTGNSCKIVILFIVLANNAWALPWFQPPYEVEILPLLQSPLDDKIQANTINFSGTWKGHCDKNPAVDLTIKHDQNQLTISYGFIEEKYVLGEIKSVASTRTDGSENSNSALMWNIDHTGLVFTNYYLFTNGTSKLNAFFSKVSMTLKYEQLLVKGQYYHTNDAQDDIEQETIFCTYLHQ